MQCCSHVPMLSAIQGAVTTIWNGMYSTTQPFDLPTQCRFNRHNFNTKVLIQDLWGGEGRISLPSPNNHPRVTFALTKEIMGICTTSGLQLKATSRKILGGIIATSNRSEMIIIARQIVLLPACIEMRTRGDSVYKTATDTHRQS